MHFYRLAQKACLGFLDAPYRNRLAGCFSSIKKLKFHNPSVLCDFLERFPGFLSSAGIVLPPDRNPDKIPYDKILKALPAPSTPNILTVQLILIDKLANETGWEEVQFEAKQRGVPLPSGLEKLCDGDRAMKVWTVAQPDHPDLLEESFARARIYKKSSYTYYPMARDLLDRFRFPEEKAHKELEAELNAHFNVDGGTKVLIYDFDAEIWFLIRHPGNPKWQGVYEKGQAKSRAVTPELYDAVVYHKKYGDLRMNTNRKSDHKRYRVVFGHLLFDESNVFDPKRKIVGLKPLVEDRFHVIRTVLRHFLETWKQLDPEGRRNRGLLSLMRRHGSKLRSDQKLRLERYLDAHPAIRIVYEVKEALCRLLNIKCRTKKNSRPLIKRLINWIWKLRYSGLPALETLAETLDNWSSEIVCMWRFTKNNGITDGEPPRVLACVLQGAFGFIRFPPVDGNG